MRPAMERQRQTQRCILARGQQQAVAAKIVEPDPIGSHRFDQSRKTSLIQRLARQQMVFLQRGVMFSSAGTVDRTEGQVRAGEVGSSVRAAIHRAARRDR